MRFNNKTFLKFTAEIDDSILVGVDDFSFLFADA
jgi:hypothetical protein